MARWIPKHARGYWFDDQGKLVKTYFTDIETQRAQFEDFLGAQVAHQINLLHRGELAMAIQVTQISPGTLDSTANFELRGHDHVRAFTDEIR